MSLKDSLKGVRINSGKSSTPLWKGPTDEGISYSLLSRYLSCKERFRLQVIEGLVPNDVFNEKLEFGNMWHLCEECHAAGKVWEPSLTKLCRSLAEKYPFEQDKVSNWMGICMVQFPIYVEYWKTHPDVKQRTPLMQEQVFDVEYKLPSGRTVTLKGKWDSVDIIGGSAVYLQENKTKGRPNETQIKRQLSFDLQTMIYLIALSKQAGPHSAVPLNGVRYNVIKRPGQYQGKKETHEGFLKRLQGIIQESPDDFFMRFKVEITAGDIETFIHQTLNPVFDNLIDDYEWWKNCFEMKGDVYNYRRREIDFPKHRARHYRHPFGVWNVLDEGGSADVDEYLRTGSETGLRRTTNLFPELEKAT